MYPVTHIVVRKRGGTLEIRSSMPSYKERIFLGKSCHGVWLSTTLSSLLARWFSSPMGLSVLPSVSFLDLAGDFSFKCLQSSSPQRFCL